MRNVGLYIHIPFCQQKCRYCDFYSLACPKKDNLSDYVSVICTHMEKNAYLYGDCQVNSIFIGGGTPSLIEAGDFLRLADTIKRCFKLTQDVEFSLEANPGTISAKSLDAYKRSGVNRLSLGLQSANDDELKVLGRIHTLHEFENSFFLAREAGFDNINVDIMYALPSQSLDKFKKTLEYVVKLAPEHISAYCLKIEDSTPFSKMELVLPDEDTQYEMYISLCRTLSEAGYEQYEISNFSKKGFRCVHNLKYWLRNEYVGFGPSAHSFFDSERYFYKDSLCTYCNAIKSGALPQKIREDESELSKSEEMDEYVMLAMRLCDGVDTKTFKERFGINFEEVYDVQRYIDSGHIIRSNLSYHFSSKGFFVSNYILSNILTSI